MISWTALLIIQCKPWNQSRCILRNCSVIRCVARCPPEPSASYAAVAWPRNLLAPARRLHLLCTFCFTLHLTRCTHNHEHSIVPSVEYDLRPWASWTWSKKKFVDIILEFCSGCVVSAGTCWTIIYFLYTYHLFSSLK